MRGPDPTTKTADGSQDGLSALDAIFLELEQADRAAHMHFGAAVIMDPSGGQPPSLEDV